MNLPLVQNRIISRLKNAGVLRHGELRPDDTAADLYNYHLKQLQEKGFVAKVEDGYTLSEKGQRYVADVWHTSDQAQRLFKVNAITIVSRIHKGELQILNQRRLAQPSYGIVGVMGGTIIKGEPLLEGASRKLQGETGLSASFKLIGTERRLLYRNDKLFSDVLFPICYADNYADELIARTEFGENFWVSIDEAIQNDTRQGDTIASIAKVLHLIKSGSIASAPLFYEEVIQHIS